MGGAKKREERMHLASWVKVRFKFLQLGTQQIIRDCKSFQKLLIEDDLKVLCGANILRFHDTRHKTLRETGQKMVPG